MLGWRLIGTLALAGVAAGASAPAQLPPTPAFVPVREAMRLLGEGRYLAAIAALRSAAADDRQHPAARMLEQVEPFVTGEPADRPAVESPTDPAQSLAIERAEARNALTIIAEQARATRIVILNEAHDVPRHRAFALEVARTLRPLGYEILAVEAFSSRDRGIAAALGRDRYPRRDTGFYVLDPVFGDFVRQALALGYRPVAYEQTSPGQPSIAEREQAQARNLVDAIFSRDSRSKVLIYVGYSHAAEAPLRQPDGSTTEWLASRLRRMTGIDPLTIDQSSLQAAAPTSEERVYHAIVQRRIGRDSSVLFAEGLPLTVGPYRGAVDLQVVHPPARRVAGRPDWLLRMNRKPIPIPARLRPRRGVRLVQAFLASEDSAAVPIDQVLVTAGRPLPSLMLPQVPIRYSYEDPPERLRQGGAIRCAARGLGECRG